MTKSILIFDDSDFSSPACQRADFGPITDLRAAFEIRTGVWTNWERMERESECGPVSFRVPAGLTHVVRERTQRAVNVQPPATSCRLMNGRLAGPTSIRQRALALPESSALIEDQTGALVAAHVSQADASRFLESTELSPSIERQTVDEGTLPRRPWDLLRTLERQIAEDIEQLQRAVVTGKESCHVIRSTEQLNTHVRGAWFSTPRPDHPVILAPTATIMPSVVFDSSAGPIFIGDQAVVRAGTIIIGPAAIGAHTVITDRSLIKGRTSIGPHCRVGGEVGGTIIQGYSNKSHEGHLGDSYVGEWVNFGAGTTNSNLLNTYGEVIVRLRSDGPRERTGMTFLGAIVGDHVKFAILTRIMTGTVIGTGAMIATSTSPPTTVPPYAWLTDDDSPAAARSFRFDKFIEVARTVMARRQITLSDSMTARLKSVYVDAVRSNS